MTDLALYVSIAFVSALWTLTMVLVWAIIDAHGER